MTKSEIAAVFRTEVELRAKQLLATRDSLQSLKYRLDASGITWDGSIQGVPDLPELRNAIYALESLIPLIDQFATNLVLGASYTNNG